MESWIDLKNRSIHNQFTFHFVCCDRFDEMLLMVEQEYFADFSGKSRAQVVNALLTMLEPFLLHHLNLEAARWELDLKRGKEPIYESAGERGKLRMEQEQWVLLDVKVYRLLKKLHEAGNNGWSVEDIARERSVRDQFRWGSFSMAMVLRAALIKCFELLAVLGRDGLVRWVEEWVKAHEETKGARLRTEWEQLKHHMVFFKGSDVKYICLYNKSYRQLYLYHPPPGEKNT